MKTSHLSQPVPLPKSGSSDAADGVASGHAGHSPATAKATTSDERRFNEVFGQRRKLAPPQAPERHDKHRAHARSESKDVFKVPGEGDRQLLPGQLDNMQVQNLPQQQYDVKITSPGQTTPEKVDALVARMVEQNTNILQTGFVPVYAEGQADRDRLEDEDLALEPGSSRSASSDSDADQPDDGAILVSLPPIHAHAAGFAAQHVQERLANQEREEKKRGALSVLIDELVDCLQMSERMQTNDWYIRLALKPNILPGTDLHLQNSGGRLSVRLVSRDPSAFRLMQENAEDASRVPECRLPSGYFSHC